MIIARLDVDARSAVLRAATEEARSCGSRTLEAEHLLLALACEPGDAAQLLDAHDLGVDALRTALDREQASSLASVGIEIGDYEPSTAPSPHRDTPRLATSTKRALQRAAVEARNRRDRRITSLHLLIGVLDTDIGTVPRMFEIADVRHSVLIAEARSLLDDGRPR
ncbi:MAG: Clp protease N-terminal domain-containing protein [Thermoleophilia bacterium]